MPPPTSIKAIAIQVTGHAQALPCEAGGGGEGLFFAVASGAVISIQEVPCLRLFFWQASNKLSREVVGWMLGSYTALGRLLELEGRPTFHGSWFRLG